VRRPLYLLGGVAFLACTSDVPPTAPPSAPSLASTNAQQFYFFDAHAVAIKGSIVGVPVNIVQAGPVASAGGQQSNSLATYVIPGVLTVSFLNASVNAVAGPTAQQTQAVARASLADLTILSGLNTIKVAVLNAEAVGRCDSTKDEAGSALVVALFVNGQRVRVGTAPNQVVPLILGQLIINEQIRGPGITVNALHLKVGLTDLIFSHAFADIALC
jgi:hypothetical protein